MGIDKKSPSSSPEFSVREFFQRFPDEQACPTPSASACATKLPSSPRRKASAKVKRSNSCPLVMIEWEDSAQPLPSWSYLASFEAPGTIRCASVGWLIRDDHIKALAPNMGAIDDENSVQISGVIQIPARCVIKVTRLSEPSLTSCCPSSRPAKGQTRQAS